MRVLMLAENDPAGAAGALQRALRRRHGVDARLCTLQTRYNHDWEQDLHLPDLDPRGLDELGELFETCDVLHFHMTVDEDTAFGPFLPRKVLNGKAVVHHHHGHHDFRGDPEKYRRKYRERGRKNLLVSTPDLLRLLPEARWQPNLVPVDDPRFLPMEDKPAGPVRLVHSPTRKDLKNTGEFLDACRRLDERGLDFELDLIDNAPNEKCLARKRRGHVLFDHMQGYYGVSSLEALSQGLAVVAGIDDWCRGRMVEFAGTEELPWVVARDQAELETRLAELIRDPERTAEIGRAGRAFMERSWSDRKVSARLLDFYRQALA
jgi:glycosyltransferase involved in cell wall biosynthesis